MENDYKLYFKFHYKLASLETKGLTGTTGKNNLVSSKLFQEGKFKIVNYKKALTMLRKYFHCLYYAGYKRRMIYFVTMIVFLKTLCLILTSFSKNKNDPGFVLMQNYKH